MPQEVERLVKEGESLSADAAEALEHGLDDKPDDLEARARLLGYYHAHRGDFGTASFERKMSMMAGRTEEHAARARHALWLAANAPRAPLSVHPLVQFQTIEPNYSDLSAIWRRHAGSDPPDATLLAHAIAFFWHANEVIADELLQRAEKLFPGDARWTRFRRERRAQELSHEKSMLRIRQLGLAPGGGQDGHEDDGKDPRGSMLDEIEQLLADDPNLEWAPLLRNAAADLALELGRIGSARAHAERMIASAETPGVASGDAAHNGHLVLGQIALREEDVERAKAHLMLAGRAGATGLVRVFGPSMRLARDLVVRGEREVVIRYLTLARAFWNRGPLDEWIADIRAGRFPDFGRNLER